MSKSPLPAQSALLPGDVPARCICLWRSLLDRMADWDADWRSTIDEAGLEARLARRSSGAPLPDADIFEGLLLSVLSGNTRWSTIARIQQDLGDLFHGFDMARFAVTTPEEIQTRIVPWFLERKAGSRSLTRGLLRLRETAAMLSRYAAEHGGAEHYFKAALAEYDGQPEDLAVALGSSPRWKLPGFGVALAAEALRNIGFDLSKPDRHVLRCIGAWSLVDFANWQEVSEFTAPQATVSELRDTMYAVKAIASANGRGVSYVNSVIWTAGALSGARLTNAAFRAIRTGCIR